MDTTYRTQMPVADTGTTANTQHTAPAAQDASTFERAQECRQRLAESVQEQPASTGGSEMAPQTDFHRHIPPEHKHDHGRSSGMPPADRTASIGAPEHSAAANDNERGTSGADSSETAAAAAKTTGRCRKAQPANTSPICDMQMLTPDDIMQALRISRSTVYNMLKRGEIPSVKIGNMLRVNKSDFEHWLEQHTTAAHAV